MKSKSVMVLIAGNPAYRMRWRAASMLREHFRNRPATTSHLDVEVQIADLSAYDAAFGTGEVA